MGDIRYERPLRRLLESSDRAGELRQMSDDDVVQALAASAKAGPREDYTTNVLATEALNRMHRARELAETLRISEAHYRSLFRSLHVPVVVGGTDRVMTDCNPAFEELLGYTAAELRGRDARLLYENDDAYAATGRELRAKMIHRERFGTLAPLKTKSGRAFLGQIRPFFIEDETGDVVGFMSIIEDVSDRERAAHELTVRAKAAAETARDAADAVEAHAARTGEGDEAPDMPAAHQVGEAADRVTRAAKRFIDGERQAPETDSRRG